MFKNNIDLKEPKELSVDLGDTVLIEGTIDGIELKMGSIIYNITIKNSATMFDTCKINKEAIKSIVSKGTQNG